MMKKFIELLDRLDPDQQAQVDDSNLGYVFTKAQRYLGMGPEKHRRADPFGMPSEHWDQSDLELVEKGCLQLMEGAGLTAEKPFKDLGVMGLSLTFQVFHFETDDKETIRNPDGSFLDKMTLRHMVEGYTVTYYNLVKY